MFTCYCGDRYIGETENLFKRDQDHKKKYNEQYQEFPNYTVID
jgi:hypothetical protein